MAGNNHNKRVVLCFHTNTYVQTNRDIETERKRERKKETNVLSNPFLHRAAVCTALVPGILGLVFRMINDHNIFLLEWIFSTENKSYIESTVQR